MMHYALLRLLLTPSVENYRLHTEYIQRANEGERCEEETFLPPALPHSRLVQVQDRLHLVVHDQHDGGPDGAERVGSRALE